MSTQTPMSKDWVYNADGASVNVAPNTPSGTPTYTNAGITKGDIEFKVSWKETKTKSGNAGYFDTEVKDLQMKGKLTLYTKDPDVMALFGGGLVTKSTDGTIPTRTHITGGSSYLQLTPFEIKVEHTDSASKVRGIKVYNCVIDSDSLGFNFLGADSEGKETWEISFTATPDPARTEGQSLWDFYVDSGAL